MGATADWPVMPIHAAITPDGRLLSYGRDDAQSPYMIYDVWDYTLGLGIDSHLTLPNKVGTDLFCSNLILLGSGNMLLVGGDVRADTGATTIGYQTNLGNPDANVFNNQTNEISKRGEMNEPRWYASVTKLPWGEVFIHGGAIDVNADTGAQRTEIASADGADYRVLSGFTIDDLPWYYPRNFVNRYGDIIGWSHSHSYRLDPRNNGSRLDIGQAPQVELNNGSVAVMYRPGKVMLGGGGKKRAIAADINGVFPAYSDVPNMDSRRLWGTATVMPDGRVLVANGGTSDTSLLDAPLGVPAKHVSIYDPDSNSWLNGPSSAHARLYHSIAILLPDATIMIGGGGFPGPVTNLNAEIYFPPYLFNPDGSRADRPVITQAPTVLNPGDAFTFNTNDNFAIDKVVLVKTGAVTHSFDVDQRYVPLSFTPKNNLLGAQLPTALADTPPGFYHLFALNQQGVPSVSSIIRINPTAASLPPRPAIGPQSVQIGGNEGTRRELSCALNERLTGVHGLGFDRINQLGPICTPIDSVTGAWNGNAISRSTAGDLFEDRNNPSAGRFAVSCPQNTAVSGFSGASDPTGRFVGRLELSCQSLGAGGQVSGTPVVSAQVGTAAATTTANCPGFKSATGLSALADVSGFYQFSLRCGA